MALDRDVPKKKGAVKWKTLFEEDREGNQLAFVETLRDQHVSWGGGVAGGGGIGPGALSEELAPAAKGMGPAGLFTLLCDVLSKQKPLLNLRCMAIAAL